MPELAEQKNKVFNFPVWGPLDKDAWWQEMLKRYEALSLDVNLIAQNYSDFDLNSEIGKMSYLVHFDWMDDAKGMLILMRDVCFEYNRAFSFHQDEQLSNEKFDQFVEESEACLQKAYSELSSGLQDISIKPIVPKDKMELWYHQDTPWTAYQKQFNILHQQMRFLEDSWNEERRYQDLFKSISNKISDKVSQASEMMMRASKSAKETIEDIHELEETDNLNATSLSSVLQELEQTELTYDQFEADLYRSLDSIPNLVTIPVGKEENQLLIRRLSLHNQVQSWIESELMPILDSQNNILKSALDGLRLALFNVGNKPSLLANQSDTELTAPRLVQPLEQITERIDSEVGHVQAYEREIKNLMQKDFLFSHVFAEKKEFLNVSFSSSMRSFATKDRYGLKKFVEKAKIQIGDWLNIDLGTDYGPKIRENDGELLVRYIEARKINMGNSYSGLFLNKGFLGESFFVGREHELNFANNAFKDWKNGYRGSLCITGTRFSGKTTLIEQIVFNQDGTKVVRINPFRETKCLGRSIPRTMDLGKVLQFIVNSFNQEKIIIVIDDVEKWNSQEINLGQNIQDLCHNISKYSTKFFFLMSISNSSWQMLDEVFGIRNYFQAELNVDTMTERQIKKAILIRHGATHKFMYDDNLDVKLKPEEIIDQINKIVSHGRHNIGECYRLWSSIIRHRNETSVFLLASKRLGRLPTFLNDDWILILQVILNYRLTNERMLRKQFGPDWKDRWLPELQTLLSNGIVRRNQEGFLVINEVLLNDLGDRLCVTAEFPYYMNKHEIA